MWNRILLDIFRDTLSTQKYKSRPFISDDAHRFMTLNPGRQLATGSFQPIDDDDWERDAYAGVAEGHSDSGSQASDYTDAPDEFIH